MRPTALAFGLALLVLVGSGERGRAHVTDRFTSIPLFAIRKTENRNRVAYDLTVDANCAPRGTNPVFAYWRMVEQGRDARESLAPVERRAYGIASQRVAEDAVGVRIDLRLRALDDRTIHVRPRITDGRCVAPASTRIGGVESVIDDVLVVQRGPLSVARIELRGRSVADDSPTAETLSP